VDEGFIVHIGHTGNEIAPDQALVVTDAIDLNSSPEVTRARELGIPIVRRSQALGWVLRPYKVIAVTGTHGKTTTTGMLGMGLIEAGMDPTVVVGASIAQFGGPVREGEGEWAVVEACEAYDSFHDLDPTIVLVTNLELDHVDFHGTWENLRSSVVRFANRVPEDGWLVYCSEDRGACEVAELSHARTVPYGITDEWLRQIANSTGLQMKATFGEDTEMALPGRHNRLNASGALMTAVFVGADQREAAAGISAFEGAERRLQVIREGEIAIVDDYAHHPTEIEATIEALRQKYPERRLVVVFQPHLYSRTAELIPEFAAALSKADFVVLTDIYPAREAPMPGVSSARIAELVTKLCRYVPSRHLLPRDVAAWVTTGDVVVGMGAGNIQSFAKDFARELDRPAAPRVAVLQGGDSAEREVSLNSGLAVLGALSRLGVDAFPVDITDRLLSVGDASSLVGVNRPDIAFLAVHGTHAEDGALQGFLELMHLPYTGSGILASAIALNKNLTKAALEDSGIPVPKGVLLTSPGDEVTFEGPWIVKPNSQGSTVGLSFVQTLEELRPAIVRAFAYDEEVLVEEWLKGMEISVPVLGDRVLPVVEIVPNSGQYDFAMKYLPGETQEIIPARLSAEVTARAQHLALRSHQALGCDGATRTDMIVRENLDPVVLEVNTLPGLTGTSLLPNSAKAAGLEFDDLIRWILEDGLARAKKA
jgi:UDP-N-acetylmuramate--L-alanine ligase